MSQITSTDVQIAKKLGYRMKKGSIQGQKVYNLIAPDDTHVVRLVPEKNSQASAWDKLQDYHAKRVPLLPAWSRDAGLAEALFGGSDVETRKGDDGYLCFAEGKEAVGATEAEAICNCWLMDVEEIPFAEDE